ncbi:Carboxylesterase type B [Penicillium angulare]|uniref:Carboxylesterase type B n=1 Tax=Penicillium angulare TaxID=116970 RepID=UPI002541FEF1|nr:Carboxylesterase type B [Penicillium angulare]KAJ5256911.1 Carboxylesterase type B [Penicillium angulare]
MAMTFSKLTLPLIALATLTQFANCQSCPGVDCKFGQSVKTTSGVILGHPGPQGPNVTEYLGIPYASPPIGQLRFSAPVNNCLAKGGDLPPYPGETPQAPKILHALLSSYGTQGEDCLRLNIWAKPDPSKLKPVLIWIHGGRFVITNSETPFYEGQTLASEHDVILVTINYRLNIFGFSGAPGLTQNVGLLDQRMAFEWVHENIAAFGGDPDRIVIFGSSAGGTSVDLYSYAWADDPLVSGLISHSGTALSYLPSTPEQAAGVFFQASKLLGCGDDTANSEQVVQCMREQPFEALFNASNNVPLTPTVTIPEPVFHAVVDDVVVFSDYKKRSAEGKFARLPYLVTCNNNEAGFYRATAYSLNITISDAAWDEFNLAAFTCPSGQVVRDRVSHGVPAWQSRYFGDWDNMRLYPGSGAYHVSDVAMILGNTARISGLPDNQTEIEISRYMASAWVAFASDPYDGLEKFGWPKYNASGEFVFFLNDVSNCINPEQRKH